MRITKSQIKRIMMEAIKEASEFGDMKTGNTYTYKNDGYTYIVIDDMWHVIKGKKKKANSTKDYISLKNKPTAIGKLDAEHPDARSKKAIKAFKDDLNKKNNATSMKNNNDYKSVQNILSAIKERIKDFDDLDIVKTYKRDKNLVAPDTRRALEYLDKKIKTIENLIQKQDVKALIDEQNRVNMLNRSLLRSMAAAKDKNKIKSALDNLARELGELQGYKDVDIKAKPGGSSNVAASSDFEFKPSADSIEVVKETVYRKLRGVLSEQFLDKPPSSGFDMESDLNFNAATGKGNYKKPEDDFEFKPSADSIEVVDTGKGDSSKAASKSKKSYSKYSKITEMIQKIIDPQEKLTKSDGYWEKNTQKAWEQHVQSQEFKNTVLQVFPESMKEKVTSVIDALPKKATAVKELGYKPSQKGVLEFIQNMEAASKKIKNKATGDELDAELKPLKDELEKGKQDKGFVKRQIEKIKKKRGGKLDRPILNKINSMLKKNNQHEVDENGDPPEDLNEGLSRGSLYRRRYHGRY